MQLLYDYIEHIEKKTPRQINFIKEFLTDNKVLKLYEVLCEEATIHLATYQDSGGLVTFKPDADLTNAILETVKND